MINIHSENLVLLKPEDEVIAEFIRSFKLIVSMLIKASARKRNKGLTYFIKSNNQDD